MINTLQARNRHLAFRLAVLILIAMLLGSALALLLRKGQSLRQLLVLHTRILANLPLMQAETSQLHQQVAAFRQALPADLAARSPDLLLYSRLDQIKSRLQPSEMTINPPEHKDGSHRIDFTLKAPISRYSAVVNGMGQLQAELFPFTDFREITLAPTAADSTLMVSGSVLLPPVTGGKP